MNQSINQNLPINLQRGASNMAAVTGRINQSINQFEFTYQLAAWRRQYGRGHTRRGGRWSPI